MNRLNIILLVIFIFPSAWMKGQDNIPPDKPYISYVSIDTSNNNTLIFWDPSSSGDVEWYNLYYEINTINGPEGIKFDSVSADNTSYIHLNNETGSKSFLYSISAQDSSGNESLRTPGFHSTIFIKPDYDSCNNSITLKWNKYIGWDNNLSGYILHIKENESSFQILTGLTFSDTSYVKFNVSENSHYSFFIEAINNNGLVSRSNITRHYTYMPGPPDDLIIDMVTIKEDNLAEIQFHFTDTSYIYGFGLLRSSNKDSDFSNIKQIYQPTENSYIIYDTILSNVNQFFYKIASINTCNKTTKESNLGVNILLTGNNEGNNNQLKWNAYENWDNGVKEYEVYRYIDQGNQVLLATLSPGDLSYSDFLPEGSGGKLSGSLIYQIKAKEFGTEKFSISNLIKIDVDTKLILPNAFTPNNDGRNDYFIPVFDYIPKNYLMIIYDRFGVPVFETNNPLKAWDGSINGKTKVTAGVYMYHIQYTSFTGSSKEKTGTLTVFYP